MPDHQTDEAHWEAVDEAAELLGEGQPAPALTALRDVVRADPRNPYAYHLVGLALAQLGQLEPARDAFRAAVTLAPNYLGARVGLAHTLRLLGHLDGAAAQAQEALRRFPDSPEAQAVVRLGKPSRDADDDGERAAEGLADPPATPEEPDWEGLRVLTGGRGD